MNRKLDFIQDGVQLEIPPGMPETEWNSRAQAFFYEFPKNGFVEGFKPEYLIQQYLANDVNGREGLNMISRAVAFWDKEYYEAHRELYDEDGDPKMGLAHRLRSAAVQVRAWLSLLKPAKREGGTDDK